MPARSELKLLKRITTNPAIFAGKPIVRGKRVADEHILGMMAAGDSIADIVQSYSFLEEEDVDACLAHARQSADDTCPMKKADGEDR